MYACKSIPRVDGILYTCTRFVVSKVHFERTMIAIMVVIIFDYGYAWLHYMCKWQTKGQVYES
jgi:hypothetical protein